jgi:glycosyltransferase involved in cell wall biosynthesis
MTVSARVDPATPKILYVVAEDWFFCQHFLPMARVAREIGCEVVVATRLRARRSDIEAAGCRVVSLESDRGSLSVIELLRSVVRIRDIVRSERPDIVHCIALRMVVIGGSAARLAGAKAMVLALTGLGHVWIENGMLERTARGVARVIIGRLLRRPGSRYLFENEDDPGEFGLDGDRSSVTIVGGAGVRPGDFPVAPEPDHPPLKVAVVARMLRPKGIAEAVAAVRRARAEGADVELSLYGPPDPGNRRTLSAAELQHWSAEPGIIWHGHATDIARVWRDHHVAMLLSYREGLPRSLVEAAAVGRPIVTTDVPGCREVVRDGIEGFLVPPRDEGAAAAALVRLAADPDLRARMGAAANLRFRERFTEEQVRRTIETLYQAMLLPNTARRDVDLDIAGR